MEKHGTVRHATDDTIIGRNRCACFVDNDTETLSEYVIIIDFLWQQ